MCWIFGVSQLILGEWVISNDGKQAPAIKLGQSLRARFKSISFSPIDIYRLKAREWHKIYEDNQMVLDQ